MNMEWNDFWHWEYYRNIVILSHDKKPISPFLFIKNTPNKLPYYHWKLDIGLLPYYYVKNLHAFLQLIKKTWTKFPDYLTREVCRLQGYVYELGLWVKGYEFYESYKRTYIDSDVIWRDINSNTHQVQRFFFPLTKVYGRR